MTAYSSQLRANEPAPSIVQSRPTITRRPSLEMPLHASAQSARAGDPMAAPKAVAVGQNAGEIPLSGTGLPGEFDLNLDLDVPAFLRRNEG
ncbi:MAG TPA: hypothetical protein VM096_01890, partial [Vicinamibacterales bacterium]|nr:hypothetical protein [Vicinamibacterales bacterium]